MPVTVPSRPISGQTCAIDGEDGRCFQARHFQLSGFLDDFLEVRARQVVAQDGGVDDARHRAGRALAIDLRFGVAAAPDEIGKAAQKIAHVDGDAAQIGQALHEHPDGDHAGCQQQPHQRAAFLDKIDHRLARPGRHGPEGASGQHPTAATIRCAEKTGKRKNEGGCRGPTEVGRAAGGWQATGRQRRSQAIRDRSVQPRQGRQTPVNAPPTWRTPRCRPRRNGTSMLRLVAQRAQQRRKALARAPSNKSAPAPPSFPLPNTVIMIVSSSTEFMKIWLPLP